MLQAGLKHHPHERHMSEHAVYLLGHGSDWGSKALQSRTCRCIVIMIKHLLERFGSLNACLNCTALGHNRHILNYGGGW